MVVVEGPSAVQRIGVPRFVTGSGANKATLFAVRVVPVAGPAYFVSKRFTQFVNLDRELRAQYADVPLPALPPKRPKILGQSNEFLEERRILLEHFLKSVLNADGPITTCTTFLNFIGSDRDADAVDIEGDNTGSMKHLLFDVDEPYEFPDLQEIRHISIPQAKVMSDHILYQIHCSATPHTELRHSHSHWVSLKRFTDFLTMMKDLRAELARTCPDALCKLPLAPPTRKSRVLHDHTDPVFVEHRRVLLEYYLNKLLRIEQAASSDIFLKYCAVPGI
ncbi:PX domain-containing protein [Plasmodiophora brassicae]|uniref:PX domain-containing protein n=1 Tax=Plasmodiophora brassicae TaxID=37360 RepID=A0A3P3YNZ3_PLABS|nr:unnamed protein product [Plasmodiophora brassicae]